VGGQARANRRRQRGALCSFNAEVRRGKEREWGPKSVQPSGGEEGRASLTRL
jgi:hypothetical protein